MKRCIDPSSERPIHILQCNTYPNLPRVDPDDQFSLLDPVESHLPLNSHTSPLRYYDQVSFRL